MLTSIPKMRGMSLIELMVALVVLSILLGMGATSFAAWTQNQKTRTAAESILNGMQLARGEAVKRNANALFVLCGNLNSATPDSSWDVLVISAPALTQPCVLNPGAAASGWERVQMRSGQEGSRNVVVSGVPGVNAVAFNGFGRVVVTSAASLNNVTSIAINQSVAQLNISNPNGDRTLQINVGLGGSPRLCDPSPKLQAGNPTAC